MVTAPKTFFVNLVLLCPNEGALVNIWMDFYVRVVGEFKCILDMH